MTTELPDGNLPDVSAQDHVLPSLIRPGEVGDTALLATTLEYLNVLSSETKRLAAAGSSTEAIIATLDQQFRTRYPDWDTSEPWRIASGVQTFLAQ